MSIFKFSSRHVRDSINELGESTGGSRNDSNFLKIITRKDDEEINTVISLIEKGAHKKSFKLLAYVHPEVLIVSIGDTEGVMNVIHNEGVDVSMIRGYNNYSPLHYAVRNGQAQLVAELIRHGVSLEARTSLG